MSLKYEINAYYGVWKYLYKSTGNTYSPKKTNKVMVEFLEGKGLPAHKWFKKNPKYHGVRNAAMLNAVVVQEHWTDFTKWVEDNPPS